MQYPCLTAATQWNVELHEIVEKLLEENNILRRIDISRGNIQKQFNCKKMALFGDGNSANVINHVSGYVKITYITLRGRLKGLIRPHHLPPGIQL